MDPFFNFILSNEKPLSKKCINKKLLHFFDVCNYVKHLPYGRNSNRSDYTLVLKENKGTCPTKHAFLAQIARENNMSDIHLYIGVYSMSAKNTEGIGEVLEKYKLSYIPEAHTYLKFEGKVFDFTRMQSSSSSFSKYLIYEEKIKPYQIGSYKIGLHKSYLKKWLKVESISYTFQELWNIREQCIASLQQ